MIVGIPPYWIRHRSFAALVLSVVNHEVLQAHLRDLAAPADGGD